MTLTPHITLLREREAMQVEQLRDRALQMDAPQRRADYEQAAREFSEKHHGEWQRFVKEREIER